jgi:hypothetical protein
MAQIENLWYQCVLAVFQNFGSPSDKEREQISKLYKDSLKEDVRIVKEIYAYDIATNQPLLKGGEATSVN